LKSKCVVPENIHTSPSKGILVKTPHPSEIPINLDTEILIPPVG